MRSTVVLAAALSLPLAAAAQDSGCTDGMRWTTAGAERPVALYAACESGEVAVAVACENGAIRMAIDAPMPRTEAGAPIALDVAVDERIYTLAGTALRSRGQVYPHVTAGPEAVDALMRGYGASIALPEGPLGIDLTGSARAIAPVRQACVG